jgi:EAL domain-containing protein (putative c-di-GMP-specific phosphodiesterase class I)
MYNAKEGGRNTYRYFSAELENVYSNRIKLENALRFAQERNQLYLVYQPQIELSTGEMVAMETLIRWKHPELGLISPSEFIPIAEETGLINSIGEWVLKESFEQYAKWLAMGYDPKRLAINISPVQLLQKNFPKLLQSHMMRHAIEPHRIEVEITETTVMSYSQESQEVLEQLHQLGVSIAIDDFGTGYSSLSHLRQLPLSALKIDRSFVKDITTDASAATIVKTVIALAKNLGFGVVAEGVEAKSQLAFLKQHGCLYAQGYYFSQPMDAEKMSMFLDQGKPRSKVKR